jgi:polyisoprenoid-binding protein YceI
MKTKLSSIYFASLLAWVGTAHAQSSNAIVSPPLSPPITTSIASTTSKSPLYVLDPAETHSRFEVKFLGIMTVRGKFNRTTGNLYHDPARHDAASRASDSIHAEIDTTTLDTNVINSHATNEMLRGPQFFHVEKFPAITFKSSAFNWDETTLKSIDGSLTLLGVSKPVTLTVEKSGCTSATAHKRARCSAEAAVNVKRADFGMKAWAASVSNDVKLIIELVAYQAGNGGVESKNVDDSATSKSSPVIPPASEPRP